MDWALRFLRSSIGLKLVMAVTGVALFGFVVGHLAGNLLIFAGRDALNAYATWLHDHSGILWGARIGLLAAVGAHIGAAVRLAALNRSARPVGYATREFRKATYASRTMMISGPLIALYVVYHLLHLTFGKVHPHGPDVYQNVVSGFRIPLVALVYIAAMVMLGAHLFHGLGSMFQSIGVSHPKYDPLLHGFAAVFAAALTAGYIAIPAAVWAGVVR